MTQSIKNTPHITDIQFHPDFPGVRLTITDGLSDYLAVRTSHLAALLQLLCSDGAEQCGKAARETGIWLAYTIALEVDSLIPAALVEQTETTD